MKQWNKIILACSVLASFCYGASSFDGIVYGAQTAPVVTALPVFKDGAVTPTRLASDGLGNIYVSDPHADGVLKYDSGGALLKKIVTAKQPSGVALAANGDLLVTQGTYVAVIDPATGLEKSRFGVFSSAFGITYDPRVGSGSAGRIYVSDISGYNIQVFNSDYTQWISGVTHTNVIGAKGTGLGQFMRPAGVVFEKGNGLLAVADSLSGRVQFFDPDGNYVNQLGSPPAGYDPVEIMFTYPQSIAFEYSSGGALIRAYVLDTFQDYVMVLDASTSVPLSSVGPMTWTRLSDIGGYGHANGKLISPSDVLIDSTKVNNSRLFVTNGFGSLSVFGLASIQPYNVFISSIGNASLTVNWTNSSTPAKWLRVYRSTVAGQLGSVVGGNLPPGTATYPDSGLSPYTTYYYTVRAVDASSVETTNVGQVSAKTTGTFGLTITVVGNGQVNGSVGCAGGVCTSTPIADSLVTLTASASGQTSQFAGWTGDCTTTQDTCLVTMNSAKSVTALFEAKLAFRVDGAYYDNMQDAYNGAKDGSVIKVLNGLWPSTLLSTEYMSAWQDKSVTIEGGYDPTFTTNTNGMSIITGRTLLYGGKVVMKQLKVQ